MAKRRKRRPFVPRCRGCGITRESSEIFLHGVCPSCRDVRSKERRGATGTRLLAQARDADSETRDGQTFRVVVLPPKRRRRR
jgi:hypothetical protein